MVNFYIFITEIAIENEHFNGLVLKSVQLFSTSVWLHKL